MFKYDNPYDMKNFMKMNESCPVCGQPLDMEPGFYYGTNLISYALTVLLSAITFLLWTLIIGISFHDNRFFWWMGVNAVLLIALQPPLMRLSRTLWLSWFVKYDPDWKEHDIQKESIERIVPEQMGNW